MEDLLKSMMTSATILVILNIYLCCPLVSANLLPCPGYCTCNDLSLNCTKGYGLDRIHLRLLSPNIEQISINKFVIRSLTASHLSRFSELRDLSMTDCRMREVDEESFYGSPFLDSIDLHNNQIEELPAKLFIYQHNLTTLNLSGNLIEHLPKAIFRDLISLENLTLSQNRIRLLPSTVFDSLSNLMHLDLSRNEIAFIHPSTFNFISLVRYIDLNDNLLVTIHEDLFNSNNVTKLTTLSVSGNPLDCNCGLVWLRSALLGNFTHLSLVDSDQVICANPRIYHKKELSKVPLEQLLCTGPTVTIKSQSLSILHGNKVRPFISFNPSRGMNNIKPWLNKI